MQQAAGSGQQLLVGRRVEQPGAAQAGPSPVTVSSTIQPSPYGSELTSSGLLSSAALTAETVPATGA